MIYFFIGFPSIYFFIGFPRRDRQRAGRSPDRALRAPGDRRGALHPPGEPKIMYLILTILQNKT